MLWGRSRNLRVEASPSLSFISRLILWVRGYRECSISGHTLFIIDGEKQNIVYKKGDVRPVKVYFAGKLYKCRRCDFEEYRGPLKPWKEEVV